MGSVTRFLIWVVISITLHGLQGSLFCLTISFERIRTIAMHLFEWCQHFFSVVFEAVCQEVMLLCTPHRRKNKIKRNAAPAVIFYFQTVMLHCHNKTIVTLLITMMIHPHQLFLHSLDPDTVQSIACTHTWQTLCYQWAVSNSFAKNLARSTLTYCMPIYWGHVNIHGDRLLCDGIFMQLELTAENFQLDYRPTCFMLHLMVLCELQGFF